MRKIKNRWQKTSSDTWRNKNSRARYKVKFVYGRFTHYYRSQKDFDLDRNAKVFEAK